MGLEAAKIPDLLNKNCAVALLRHDLRAWILNALDVRQSLVACETHGHMHRWSHQQ